MRTTEERRGRARPWQKLVAWATVASLLAQSGTAFAVGTPNAFVEAVRSEQARLKRLLDREALLDELDYDASNIIDFVTDEIVFQPYRGVLRGIQGTLEGRAGNAHDQALTLAALLNDAGFEAQILTTELSQDQARALNASMAIPRHPELRQPSAYPRPLQQLLARSRQFGVSTAELIDETRAVSARLHRWLENPASDSRQGLLDELLDSSLSYRWVRYREGPSDPWTEVHPAHPAAAEWSLAFSSVEAGTIDPSALQGFGMEVWIEDSEGNRHSVSGRWSAPTANVAGRELVIEIASNATMRPELWMQPDRLVDDSRYFYVQINGGVPEDAKAFDLRGNVYGRDAIIGLDSLFATFNQKANQAADALRGLGSEREPAQPRQLTRVWLNFHISRPGGGERVVTRTIFEGAALAEPSATALALLQRWDVSVASTTPMPQYYQYEQGRQLISALERLERLQSHLAAADPADPADPEILQAYAKAVGNPSEARLVYLRSLFDQFPLPDQAVSYLHEANILAMRHGLRREGDAWRRYEMADIVHNDRWSWRRTDGKVRGDPEWNLARGVWETRAETMRLTSPEGVAFSTSAYSRLAQVAHFRPEPGAAGEPWRLIPADSQTSEAWWQVDGVTGSTIGMIRTPAGSGGAALTEEALFQIIGLAITGALFCVGSFVCTEGGGDWKCCIVSNFIIAVIGTVLALALGLVATAVGVGWGVGAGAGLLLDVGLTNVTVTCSAPRR
jgi:hypothetical protein